MAVNEYIPSYMHFTRYLPYERVGPLRRDVALDLCVRARQQSSTSAALGLMHTGSKVPARSVSWAPSRPRKEEAPPADGTPGECHHPRRCPRAPGRRPSARAAAHHYLTTATRGWQMAGWQQAEQRVTPAVMMPPAEGAVQATPTYQGMHPTHPRPLPRRTYRCRRHHPPNGRAVVMRSRRRGGVLRSSACIHTWVDTELGRLARHMRKPGRGRGSPAPLRYCGGRYTSR